VTVWVVIPWRAGCEHRQRALDYVTRWWSNAYPDWPVVVGEWPVEAGPWRKGCAVRAAGIHPEPDDLVVVSDADVIPIGVGEAVEAIEPTDLIRPSARWAMPFRTVHRLTVEGTRLAIGGHLDLTQPIARNMRGVVEETYVGSAGGGVVVMRGDVFATIPIDPRFVGYGQEDLSWSLALHLLAGAPAMRMAPLWHLWHPPQERMRRGSTVSRGVGSEAGLRLWHRYRQATTPAVMRSLVAEAEVKYVKLMGDSGVGTR
jgi:hypothetical protein